MVTGLERSLLDMGVQLMTALTTVYEGDHPMLDRVCMASSSITRVLFQIS